MADLDLEHGDKLMEVFLAEAQKLEGQEWVRGYGNRFQKTDVKAWFDENLPPGHSMRSILKMLLIKIDGINRNSNEGGQPKRQKGCICFGYPDSGPKVMGCPVHDPRHQS